MDEGCERLVALVRERSENLYLNRRMYCAESVLLTLNHGFGGGLSEKQAVGLAAPFSEGMGGSGCACGALSGGVLALGLFLGERYPDRKQFKALTHRLHEAFKDRFGMPCCRIISRPFAGDRRAHFRHCAALTGEIASVTARLLLEVRPELARRADVGFLARRDAKLRGLIDRVRAAR